MLSLERVQYLREQGRYIAVAETGDEDLGPLKLLPGTWKNTGDFVGRGWNSIALPFAQPDTRIDYRVLVNQFNEELKFTLIDKAVPNRGISQSSAGSSNTDQFVVTLDYEQMVKQIMADDRPLSGLAGAPDLAIHHEPGLWLHMTNLTTNGRDIGRLGTVPHGDSLLALGTSTMVDGSPVVPDINGLPVGVNQDLESFYLSPYKHFNDTPFVGDVTFPGFPGFNPVRPNGLLIGGLPANVTRTTVLHVDTTFEQAGISNIPFIVKQANATTMNSTFWIMELDEDDGTGTGNPKLVLAYSQFIMLEFFPRRDGVEGLIQWPHVSINMMEKVAEADTEKAQMPST